MATIFAETFEAEGYDLSWTEPAPSAGCSIDEDDAGPGTMVAGSTEDAKIVITGASGSHAHAYHSEASEYPTTYTRIYFYWSTDNFSSTSHGEIIAMAWHNGGDSNNFAWRLYCYYVNTDNRKLLIKIYSGGTTLDLSSSSFSKTSPGWHYVEIKYDAQNQLYEWKLDGTTQHSGSLTAAYRSGVKTWMIGTAWSNGYQYTAYEDWIKVNNDSWPGEQTEAPAIIPYNPWLQRSPILAQ